MWIALVWPTQVKPQIRPKANVISTENRGKLKVVGWSLKGILSLVSSSFIGLPRSPLSLFEGDVAHFMFERYFRIVISRLDAQPVCTYFVKPVLAIVVRSIVGGLFFNVIMFLSFENFFLLKMNTDPNGATFLMGPVLKDIGTNRVG